MKFSVSEWMILAVVGSVHFCCAICISLQAPFYPEEAEKKGCTATEYGFVFGSFELVAFITSPIFGSLIQKFGLKSMLVIGIILNAVSTIAFGYLTIVDDRIWFLMLSLFLRVLESLGATGAMVAAFSLTAASFPDSVASTFSALEVCYGMGYIVGPTLGALLFQVGGFSLPFIVMGFITLCTSFLVCILMKKDVPSPGQAQTKVLQLMSVPTVLMNSIATVITATAMGYYSATLEPHIRDFGLSPIDVGFVFIISGGTYAFIAPFVGHICDRGFNPKKIMILGTVLTVISFSIVGPAPFVPLKKTLLFVVTGLVIQGVALGMICVPTFVDSMTAAFESGFPNDIHTYGLLSGIWSSSFALGAFLGPSIAGFLYDLVGFEKGTYFEIVLHLSLGSALTVFLCARRRPHSADKFALNGMTESTVNFVQARGDRPVPDYGAGDGVGSSPKHRSPVYAINSGGGGSGSASSRSSSFTVAQRFGTAYGSFSSGMAASLNTAVRMNSSSRRRGETTEEAAGRRRDSPLTVESHI